MEKPYAEATPIYKALENNDIDRFQQLKTKAQKVEVLFHALEKRDGAVVQRILEAFDFHGWCADLDDALHQLREEVA